MIDDLNSEQTDSSSNYRSIEYHPIGNLSYLFLIVLSLTLNKEKNKKNQNSVLLAFRRIKKLSNHAIKSRL